MVEKSRRIQFSSSTSWLELVVMILARLRKVLMMKNAPPISIAKAYHDAGVLFLQQAKSSFSSNQTAVTMLNMGGTLLRDISKELTTWCVKPELRHNEQQVRTILQKLFKYEKVAIMSGVQS